MRGWTPLAGAALVALGLAIGDARPGAAPAPALDDATIVHILGRTGFGATPGDIDRVRQLGLDGYIDEQLHPERLADAAVRQRLAGLETLALDSNDIAAGYVTPLMRERRARKRTDGETADGATMDKMAGLSPEERDRLRDLREKGRKVLDELGEQKVLRAVYSPRQLEEVLVDFWFNHFNVFSGKGPVRIYLTEYERDAIRPHVLGRFRDLLGAVAQSPAMLFYLDNWQSVDPQAAGELRSRIRRPQAKERMPHGINENYARELMELHTLGVDGGYTQQDVVEVARAFTGWTIRMPRQGGGFRFEPRFHAAGPKLVLGKRIDAGGERDGEAVLDLLASHPATARFIATKLARRFVADEPPPTLVARAAETFRATDGDLRAVVRTILTSDELLAAGARGAKVKTPLEFVVSALRTTGADVADASAVVRRLAQLGMPLYGAQPPTGYADTAAAWVNTGALVNRMNFAVDLTANRLPGVRVDLPASGGLGDPQAAALRLGAPEFQRR
jgi:uncharacterized protein (DUF1800 family)